MAKNYRKERFMRDKEEIKKNIKDITGICLNNIFLKAQKWSEHQLQSMDMQFYIKKIRKCILI